LNAKDRLYNQGSWEVRRRSPDWRMRSRSDDGWDNITHLERGPQGPGGIAITRWLRTQRRMTKLVDANIEGWSKHSKVKRACRDRA